MSPRARPRLWVFNLDAELELARSGPYQPTQAVLRALGPAQLRARRLMAAGDACVDDAGAPAPTPPGGERWLGAAWCPTTSALARLERAGAELPPSPSMQVLRRVNHRRFYLELGGGAPGARYVTAEDELRATLAEQRTWLFKRPFGFAGRGQRRIPPEPSADDRRWLADGLRLGGLLAEPWLELTRELSIHGLLDAQGRLALGHVCVQRTDAYRAWLESARATPEDASAEHVARLHERASEVAAALAEAGYFGPFGLDAYLYRSAAGNLELNPLGELNARYSMGFPSGDPRF